MLLRFNDQETKHFPPGFFTQQSNFSPQPRGQDTLARLGHYQLWSSASVNIPDHLRSAFMHFTLRLLVILSIAYTVVNRQHFHPEGTFAPRASCP